MDKKKDLDDFWDIDDIVPKKKLNVSFTNTDTTEVEVAGADTRSGSAVPLSGNAVKEKSLFRATELVCEYSPENPLIKNVRLFAWPTSYNYYEKFKADARYFFARNGEECEYSSFFSYIPQYYQLTKSQFAFYLWFRENARRGEYIHCDFSYIMLYIYELLNIPEMLSPKQTVKNLCGIWRAYRDRFPRLDKYLVEWICDFCLINRISLDINELGPMYKDIIDQATLKEFYAPKAKNKDEAYALLSISALSGYDFKKSKYAKCENAEIFEKNIVGAIGFAISQNSLLENGKMRTATLKRDSFGGALCASDIKRVIEVEHYSLAQSYELRSVITNSVKYAENSVRASLGIKSRLGNLSVPSNVRESIDAYMSENLIGKKALKKEIPEYERRYELPVSDISSQRAGEIERSSWETTKLLVDAFEEKEDIIVAKQEEKPSKIAYGEDAYAELLSILDADEIEFIKFALLGDGASQVELCKKSGKLPEVMAEIINSSAADICSDIILEESGTAFTVIEDYKEDISKWIK